MAVTFQQQGAVDWVALSSNAANFSVQLLQRISTAGIDAYTILVGQAVCGSLLCRSDGRGRFINALKACNGLAGYRNMLWFGFGVKHIATALIATDQGTTCAALCACLAECYSTEFAAAILMEMTRESMAGNETIPSLLQWHQLVKSCAGLVTNSTFGIHAEQMMRLAGDRRTADERHHAGKKPYGIDRGVAHKTDIAKTLLGLGKLSRGQLFQMTIIGGANAGFLAAVADWLLDIRVEIRGWEATEEAQHLATVFRSRNCGPDQQPQLLVICEKNISEDSIHCAGQTYRLSDARQVIRREDGWTQATLLSGRVPWEKAFEYTFSQDFKSLIRLESAFGGAIGSAARIYLGLFEAENLPREWLRDCRSYYPDSYGMNYLHFTLLRFPELEPLRDAMYRAARAQLVGEATSNFETHMKSIAAECGCHECCPTDDDNATSNRAFCLVYLSHAIIRTSRALSGMITELCPMRAGLEAMFWDLGRGSDISATASASVIDQNTERWHSGGATKVLLCAADMIFGGDRIKRFTNVRDWTCAIAENGLCYFFDILAEPAFGAGRAARVHVIPGQIEHMGRAYSLLSDVDPNPPPRSGLTSIAWKDDILDRLTKAHNGSLDTLVEERLDGLSIRYGIEKDGIICDFFGPARAIHSMCRNEGLVPTLHPPGKCGPSPQSWEIRTAILKSIYLDEAFCRLHTDDKEFVFVLGDTWTRLDAAANLWNPIIQRVECLNCCINHGVLNGSKQVAIIMGINYIEGMKMNEAAKKALPAAIETQ